MFRKISDFINDWKYETSESITLLNMLTDDVLNKELIGEVRKIGKLAWHIVGTNNEMLGKAGLTIKGSHIDSAAPTTVKEIVEGYTFSAASVAEEVAKCA